MQKRAGIILYLRTPKAVYYGFGIDCHSKGLTDFGGHREPIDRDLIDTALREFSEESLDNLVSGLDRDVIETAIEYGYEVDSDYTQEYFIELPSNPQIMHEISSRFKRAVRHYSEIDPSRVENCGIEWLDEAQIRHILTEHPEKMYPKLRPALNKWFLGSHRPYY